VRIDKKENRQEKMSINAMIEVNSSTRLASEKLEMCNDVITKRQKPRRFAAVFKMCSDIFFDMDKCKGYKMID